MKSYIREDEVSRYSNLHDIKILESREDVATLLDVYRDVLDSGVPSGAVTGVRGDSEGHYFFVVSERRSMFGLDIVTFINNKYSSRKVTNANLNLLFPAELSRGLYGEEKSRRSSRTMGKGVIPNLYYEKENLLITVPRDGEIIIGRSDKRSNFVIKGNGKVSRVQCKVFLDKREGSLRVDDCNSSYGTYVNGVRVGRNGTMLEVGDTISFVGEKFLVTV